MGMIFFVWKSDDQRNEWEQINCYSVNVGGVSYSWHSFKRISFKVVQKMPISLGPDSAHVAVDWNFSMDFKQLMIHLYL